jgi:hypothetical protein
MRPVCGLMTVLCPPADPPGSTGVATQRVRISLGGQILSKQGISLHSGGLLRCRCSLLRSTGRRYLRQGGGRRHSRHLFGCTGGRGRALVRLRPQLSCTARRSPVRAEAAVAVARRSGREGQPRSQHRNLHADGAVRLARISLASERRLAADIQQGVAPGCRARQAPEGMGSPDWHRQLPAPIYQHRHMR